MRKHNEVSQCIALPRCQCLELCVPSNDAKLRKQNVNYHSEPVNLACCIMKKSKTKQNKTKCGSCLKICWWSPTTELYQRILGERTRGYFELCSHVFYLFLLQFYVLIKGVN